MAKATPAKKAPSKSEVFQNIAQATDLKRRTSPPSLMPWQRKSKALGNRGPGVFQIPGLVKIIKPQTPAKPAIKNWEEPVHRRDSGQAGHARQDQGGSPRSEESQGNGLK